MLYRFNKRKEVPTKFLVWEHSDSCRRAPEDESLTQNCLNRSKSGLLITKAIIAFQKPS